MGVKVNTHPNTHPNTPPYTHPFLCCIISSHLFLCCIGSKITGNSVIGKVGIMGGGVWVGLWVGVRWVDPPIRNAHKQWDVAVLRWVLGSFCEFVGIYMQRMRSAS